MNLLAEITNQQAWREVIALVVIAAACCFTIYLHRPNP